MITKSKRDELFYLIDGIVRSNSYIPRPNGLNGQLIDNMYQSIEMAIQRSVSEGFRTLLDNLYTHEDLEEDLQLK